MSDSELRALLEEHHEPAYGWALCCCDRRREDAEDVLQAAYLKVLDGKARFNGGSSFRTWLFAVVRNTAADHKRSWLRRLWRESETETAESSTRAPEDGLWVESALEKLPRRQREALHLTFYEGMTVEEASAVMGVSVGSARTHYQRGKTKLRELLADGTGER